MLDFGGRVVVAPSVASGFDATAVGGKVGDLAGRFGSVADGGVFGEVVVALVEPVACLVGGDGLPGNGAQGGGVDVGEFVFLGLVVGYAVVADLAGAGGV